MNDLEAKCIALRQWGFKASIQKGLIDLSYVKVLGMVLGPEPRPSSLHGVRLLISHLCLCAVHSVRPAFWVWLAKVKWKDFCSWKKKTEEPVWGTGQLWILSFRMMAGLKSKRKILMCWPKYYEARWVNGCSSVMQSQRGCEQLPQKIWHLIFLRQMSAYLSYSEVDRLLFDFFFSEHLHKTVSYKLF